MTNWRNHLYQDDGRNGRKEVERRMNKTEKGKGEKRESGGLPLAHA